MGFIAEFESLYPDFGQDTSFVQIELNSMGDCNIIKLNLNQPENRNPMDLKTADLFSKFFDFCLVRKTELPFQALLIEGSGPAFSAGGDFEFLKQRPQLAPDVNIAAMTEYYNSFLKIRLLPVVTIANVHASAIGAGLCLALACDLMLVQKQAKLGFPFLKLGINPGMAAYPLLRRRVGETRARDLLFSGRYFSGEQFFQWGGAWHTYSQKHEAQSTLSEWLRGYSSSSSHALARLRDEILVHEALEIDVSLSTEAQGQAECYAGSDFQQRLENTLQQISKKSN